MVLTAVTDILFAEEPQIDALRDVAARAFGVDAQTVAVGPLLELAPPADAQVILQRQPEDLPGDFPVWYGLAVESSLTEQLARAIDTVAHGLGIVAISDADDDDDMTLHLPDGSDHVVHLEQDEDDAFRITPEIQHLIEHARHRAAGSESSPADTPQDHPGRMESSQTAPVRYVLRPRVRS